MLTLSKFLLQRLGPRANDRNNRRSLQLESDGEEEEDDSKKVCALFINVVKMGCSRKDPYPPSADFHFFHRRGGKILEGVEKF